MSDRTLEEMEATARQAIPGAGTPPQTAWDVLALVQRVRELTGDKVSLLAESRDHLDAALRACELANSARRAERERVMDAVKVGLKGWCAQLEEAVVHAVWDLADD